MWFWLNFSPKRSYFETQDKRIVCPSSREQPRGWIRIYKLKFCRTSLRQSWIWLYTKLDLILSDREFRNGVLESLLDLHQVLCNLSIAASAYHSASQKLFYPAEDWEGRKVSFTETSFVYQNLIVWKEINLLHVKQQQ